MPAPTTLHFTNKNGRLMASYANITSFRRGVWQQHEDLYRDLGWEAGKGLIKGFTSTYGEATDVPIVGQDGTAPAANLNNGDGLFYATPDNMSHVSPRVKTYTDSGYILAFNSVTIPTATTLGLAGTFSASNTTDEMTLASHGFASGDTVTASISTYGFSTSALYTVVKLTANTIKLLTSAGVILDVTTGTVSVTLTVVRAAPLDLTSVLSIVAIPDRLRWIPHNVHPDVAAAQTIT